jgi:hypothetical protein
LREASFYSLYLLSYSLYLLSFSLLSFFASTLRKSA